MGKVLPVFETSRFLFTKTISTSKSEHVSDLCPDFFNCNFIAVFCKCLCNVNLTNDFRNHFVCKILISFQQQQNNWDRSNLYM